MERKQTFFDFAAEVGLTKHLGNVNATDELAKLCHISQGDYVLDVGCGAGVTPCYLAKKFGCRVVGIDILARMVERSWERAEKEGVSDKVSFRVADAQELPFDDDLFDAVITESVTAFPENKDKALKEYVRVTRPGGYVGLNESTWIKPPPPEMVEWISQDVGGQAQPLAPDEWKALLERAGLQDIVTRIEALEVREEVRGIFQRYGVIGMLGVYSRQLRLYIRNQAYRDFIKGVRQVGIKPENIDEYFGYGLYVGRKVNQD